MNEEGSKVTEHKHRYYYALVLTVNIESHQTSAPNEQVEIRTTSVTNYDMVVEEGKTT